MHGIEILATEQIPVAWELFNWHNFWIMVSLVGILAMIFGVVFGLQEASFLAGIEMFSIVVACGVVIFGTLIGFATVEPTAYTTQYKVTIDESVSMTEFLDKYEIIEQECKIYTVREKTQ